MQDIYRMMEERSSREFAPEGEFDKQAWAERKQSERQEAFDRADAAALRANSDPAALETYMRVAAQLPHHSATNILLIADRIPNATRVGTAEHWRRQGASVRRGQKAIPIIEPVKEYVRDDGSIGVLYDVRKVFDVNEKNLSVYSDELGKTLGEALLAPTRIYVRPVLDLISRVTVKGVSHITGGGFYENIPRALPDGMCAKIDSSALEIPPIFDLIEKTGHISRRDMFNTFNMGSGMVLVVKADEANQALAALKAQGEDAKVIGEVVSGAERVVLQ